MRDWAKQLADVRAKLEGPKQRDGDGAVRVGGEEGGDLRGDDDSTVYRGPMLMTSDCGEGWRETVPMGLWAPPGVGLTADDYSASSAPEEREKWERPFDFDAFAKWLDDGTPMPDKEMQREQDPDRRGPRARETGPVMDSGRESRGKDDV